MPSLVALIVAKAPASSCASSLLHEGDAKLTGGVALACRQVQRGTGTDQRNEHVGLLVAERLPGLSGEAGDLGPGLELVKGESLLFAAAPRPAQSSSPSPVLAVSSGSVSTNSSVESVARLAATSAASALRPSAGVSKTNARPLRRATSPASLRGACPTVCPCPLCSVQA